MLDWGVECVEYLSGCSGGGHMVVDVVSVGNLYVFCSFL